MKIYHYNPDTGIYVGEGVADESPLEPGVWMIPANSVTTAPPDAGENQFIVFNNGNWEVNTVPEPEPESEPEPEPESPTPQQLRQWAFQQEADPLYFAYRAGEGDETAWLAKREEIRARYPYPEQLPY